MPAGEGSFFQGSKNFRGGAVDAGGYKLEYSGDCDSGAPIPESPPHRSSAEEKAGVHLFIEEVEE
jgi:hypothetical protein